MTAAMEYVRLAEQAGRIGEPQEAERVASKGLNEHPDNVPLLITLGRALIDQDRSYQASLVFERAGQINPDVVQAWTNLSKCYGELTHSRDEYYDKADHAFKEAIRCDPENTLAYVNRGFIDLERADYDSAYRLNQEALKREPKSDIALFNMSIAMLANHMWEEGWYCYDRHLLSRYNGRNPPDYGLPLWEGQEDATVILAGEQGLGDEIMFASMIPDLQKTNAVVIDTVPRLEKLFGRSFGCVSHGTRHDDAASWKRGPVADFWLPMGSLGAFFRTGDFPGAPYLKPDPERRVQWRALLDSLGDKPKIGIAWSGGIKKTNERKRSLTLYDINPILEFDADWISLQYKNTDVPDFMHHWPRAVEADDYDETAALIAELDLVISVTTTAVHCAGALGKETWVLVPESPQWRYGTVGDRMPWYSSVELLRQKDGIWPIQEVCERLSRMNIERCRNLSTRTPITVLPRKATRRLSQPSSPNAVLEKSLITGLGKVA